MSPPSGPSHNLESQETRPEDPGAAFPGKRSGAATALPHLVGLLLALATLLVYLPAARDAFLIYDDGTYVTDNRVVQQGLTWAGVKWAFTTGHGGNWHPATWLSHMLDCSLFDLNPGAHHVVNAFLHALNTALLFALLFRLTAALWPAAFVAALFAWHPLHVESVAWVSERKDVLSTCFGLLALWAYVSYASHKPASATRFYLLSLFCFALGLMAKPMLVTLPFVMLLLDYWPLQRLSTLHAPRSTLRRLMLEKWPFFLLTAVSCVVTYLAQRQGEAVMTLQQLSLPLRIANALIAYVLYLAKMIWPVNLAVFYPLPGHISWIRMMAAEAVLVLGVISWGAWRLRRICPCLLTGWLWFLGTLVPVIGLVQVGSAAMADRYTYFPMVGVLIAIAYGARDLVRRRPGCRTAVGAAGVAAPLLCVLLTERQLHYWRDSESLFAHTLAVTENNAYAMNNYGVTQELAGRKEAALAWYRKAVQIDPGNVQAQYNLGNVLDKLGQPEAARRELLKAVDLDPGQAYLHNTLGTVLVELGRFDEAARQFAEAQRLDPTDAWVPFETGMLYLKQGREAEAVDQFRLALRLDPDNFQILATAARVLAADENSRGRDGPAAVVLAIKANTLTGGLQPSVLDVLGMAFAAVGRFDEAKQAAQQALALATAAGLTKLEPIQQRIRLYQQHQPWRESFLATNTPAGE